MKRRKLGRTGLEVSELGMGGLFVSSVGGELEQAREAVRRAMATATCEAIPMRCSARSATVASGA